MPEMPEIQAHAERMAADLTGRTLTRFELLNFASLKTFTPLADGAVDATVTGVDRRGKYLLLRFDNGHSHAVHLMQGGRWRPDPKRSKKPKLGMARWVFSSGGAGPNADHETAWLLTEAGSERKAGVWALDGDPAQAELFASLGPEADRLERSALADALGGHSKRLHGLLRDQQVMAGLGRLLANEILYEAKLSPFVNARSLTDQQMDQLHDALMSVVSAATDHERTLGDIGKSSDRPSKVHNRSGQPCRSCGDTIRTVEYRAYTVYYCPTEQTDGKLLADNTTSKFLK